METSPTERDDYSAVSVQLLSHSGLIILFIFLILGIWNNITAVVILLSILFAAVGIAKFWSHYSLRNVFYERLLSESRTFQGENIQLTIRVSNNKLLPLAWLDINDKLPTELPILLAANEESLKARLLFLSHYQAIKEQAGIIKSTAINEVIINLVLQTYILGIYLGFIRDQS